MNIKILENKKNRLVFELEGTTHTFCNGLKDELWNVDGVTVSTYTISHPLVGKPTFYVETDKGTPKDALLAAAKKLKASNNDFLAQFKALK